MSKELRRTWAEIDLDALEHNYHTLRRCCGAGVKFLGVVKADAYGHGAVQVSHTLQQLGADYLAVSNLDEARELRQNGVDMPILILGHTPADQVETLLRYHITQTVSCEAKALEYSQQAQRCGGLLKIHIKVDTGMSRLGFLCEGEHLEGGVRGIARACALPGLEAEGIFTHFAVSDEKDEESKKYTLAQFSLFETVIARLEQKGIHFAIRHCANSGAVVNYPQMMLDMARPGILLYGCGAAAQQLELRPVMRLKSCVSTVKVYDPGTTISYGRLYRTEKKTRIGVLPVGYADGLMRCLSNRFSVVTEQGMAPQRGRICMDMCMVDLTACPAVDVGSEVEIFGEHQLVHSLAELAGTIPYELTCAVSKRVPRLYFRYGRQVDRELRLLVTQEEG